VNPGAESRRPASPWRRLAARAIDLVTVFFCLFAVAVMGGGALIDGAGQARVAFVVLLVVYEGVFVARVGQTPGKDLLRVKVAVAGSADTPGAGRTARRLPLVSLPLLVPDPVVAASVLLATGVTVWLRPGRGLHDLLAGTWVVHYHADEEEDVEEADVEPLQRLRREHGPFRRLFDRER
jgi:uncharacterized RDD family membrane protein YckC